MLPDRYTLPLLGIVALCTLPHVQYLSPWVIIACLFLWTYTAMAARFSWRRPAKAVLVLLSGLFFMASMLTHEGLTIEAFVAVLALMAGLKILEIRKERDRVVTVIMCYFLIVGGMFFSDTLWSTSYKLAAIICTTAVLIYISFPGSGKRVSLKVALAILVQAVPLMLVLFLFFPRIQGGIWGRTHLNLARTGFTDELSFGSIAQLAQSTDIAFRVEFDGPIPQQDMLYWRGIVLWFFDGRKWERNLGRRNTAPDLVSASRPVNYSITLEPHNEHWLLALDLPTEIDLPRARILYDYIGYRWRPITSRVTYRVTSFTSAREPLHEYYLRRALQLPEEGNPRARALARSLYEKAENDEGYVQHVLNYFREQPFSYTLTPTLLVEEAGRESGHGQNLMDRFLFESRNGFCEHFAGSFVFLMRAAGVPARLVLGYQGGTLNEYGNYLVVRQSNAHAWTEVWIENKGWVRVDPTGVLAPDRLTSTADSALLSGAVGTFLTLQELGIAGKWLNDLRYRFDFYNNLWNRWVMTYSINEQVGFFGSLGIKVTNSEGAGKVLLVFLIAVVLIIIVINLSFAIRPQKSGHETTWAWNSFCRKLAMGGLPREPNQGPADYMKFITAQRPDLTRQVQEIISSYIAIQYEGKKGAESVSRLEALVRQFKPKRYKV